MAGVVALRHPDVVAMLKTGPGMTKGTDHEIATLVITAPPSRAVT
jgi:hypothetical protein